jgi:hypothetical protein
MAVIAAGAMIGSAALAQGSVGTSRPVFSGHSGKAGAHFGRGGFHDPGKVRHRKPQPWPAGVNRASDSKQVFRRDDSGWWEYSGFGFDNRINKDDRRRHKHRRGRDDDFVDYPYGYAYGDGDGYAGYYGGEPADYYGFFGNGGRIHKLPDGTPVYEYDRSYPYEYSSASSRREARAPVVRSYATSNAECSTELVPSGTSTLSVPVRICRGR